MRVNFVLSEVAAGLRRNLTMTVAMILTTAISLGLMGTGLLIARMIGDMKEIYCDKVEVSIYLRPTAITEPQREAIAASWTPRRRSTATTSTSPRPRLRSGSSSSSGSSPS